jgi:hypothetical protein
VGAVTDSPEPYQCPLMTYATGTDSDDRYSHASFVNTICAFQHIRPLLINGCSITLIATVCKCATLASEQTQIQGTASAALARSIRR